VQAGALCNFYAKMLTIRTRGGGAFGGASNMGINADAPAEHVASAP